MLTAKLPLRLDRVSVPIAALADVMSGQRDSYGDVLRLAGQVAQLQLGFWYENTRARTRHVLDSFRNS